jgi:hypothetical protein
MPNGSVLGPRAGFWRRLAALLFDAIIVIVPLEFLFAVLYAITGGSVQAGALFSQCQVIREIPQLSEPLKPPPPVGWNFGLSCRGSSFGLETGRWLVIGRVTKEGNVTKSVSQSYAITPDGKIRNVTRLDWLLLLAFFTYLATLEWRFGATLGNRLLRTRVLDVAHPGAVGIPLRKALVRNLLIPAGGFPMLALFLGYLIAYRGNLEAISASNFFAWFAVAGALSVAWNLWIFIDIVRKRDPIYDRIA